MSHCLEFVRAPKAGVQEDEDKIPRIVMQHKDLADAFGAVQFCI
jgi:hypothetical protein